MGRFIDLTGQRFGRLLVIKRVNSSQSNRICWLCKCDCGNKKIVSSNNLRRVTIKSCNCL